MKTNQIRVLVVDDDIKFQQILGDSLKRENYNVKVVNGKGQRLIETALNTAKSFRPHIAIVDIDLFDTDGIDKSGLQMLADLESAKCILYSSYLFPGTTREAKKRFPKVSWVEKTAGLRVLLEEIKDLSKLASAEARLLSIYYPRKWPELAIKALFRNQLELPSSMIQDVIAQLFPNSGEITLETLDGSIITPQSVSRGRSSLMKVYHDSRIEPLILKIAPAEAIAREGLNYNKYILDNLRGKFHAMLSGEPAIFWDIGALLYTLVDHPGHSLKKFGEFYEKTKDPEDIVKPLEHLFISTWGGIYNQSEKSKTTLSSFYEETFYLSKKTEQFNNKEQYIALSGIDFKIKNPVSWLERHKLESDNIHFKQAITHGDLHADNIIVDENHAWAIDFERSGVGHNLRDFIELEVDIFTRLIGANEKHKVSHKELFRMAIFLTDTFLPSEETRAKMEQLANPAVKKALAVIYKLRSICQQMTQFSDFREYMWGLLFDLVFLITLVEENKSQRDRALLYGSLVCQRIANGQNGIWPPIEWTKITKVDKKDKVAKMHVQSQENDNLEPPLIARPVPKPITAIISIIMIILASIGALWGITKINPSPLVLTVTIVIFLPIVIAFSLAVSGLVTGELSLRSINEIVLAFIQRFYIPRKNKELNDENKK